MIDPIALITTLAFFAILACLVLMSIRREKKLLAQGICPTCDNTGLHPLQNGTTIPCENKRCPLLDGAARGTNANIY